MIVFEKRPPQGEVLYAYNNNLLEFYSNFPAQAVSATVVVNGHSFTLFPDPQGRFRANLKNYVPVLINNNNFADGIPQHDEQFIAQTANGTPGTFLQVTVAITVSSGGLLPIVENTSLTLPFLKGVMQAGNYKNNQMNGQTGRTLYVLAPTPNNMQPCHAVLFSGYPLDISVLSTEAVAAIALLNTTTQSEYIAEQPQNAFVHRLYISNGYEGIDAQLGISFGENDIIIGTGENSFTLKLKKTEERCGVYLKWLNPMGGWSYWLFDPVYSMERSVVQTEPLENDFHDLRETVSPYISTGYESSELLNIAARNINSEEKYLLDTLAESPKIYLFKGERNQPFSRTDWLEVSLKAATYKTQQNKRDVYNYSFGLQFPKRNTMTLWM